jgi:hypothetical protein
VDGVRVATLALVAMLPVLSLGDARSGIRMVAVGPVSVSAPSPEQLDLVVWAVDRYERVGLEAPGVLVVFHPDERGCHGLRGYYEAAIVDICNADPIDQGTRDTLLHEMAHRWSEVTLTPDDRSAFMAARSLVSWNGVDVAWAERGWEQASEIMAWGLGERRVLPEIPDHGCRSLTRAFELLTGRTPPPGPCPVGVPS